MRQMQNAFRQSIAIQHYLQTAKNQPTIVNSHEAPPPEEPVVETPVEPIIESQPEPIIEPIVEEIKPVVEEPVVEEPKIEEPKSMPSRLPNFNRK